jgi:phosphopantetheinyl transferase
MPIYNTFKPKKHTVVIVWEIIEDLNFLKSIYLNENSLNRVLNMKSQIHQKGFLSVRHLLKELNYSDDDLFYTSDGKPHLKDGKRISITHSFDFSAIIVSDNEVGIDIEKNREKIIKIAPKFIGDENLFLKKYNLVEQLTVIWGAKESLYKIHPNGGLLFKKHLPIEPFNIEEKQTKGWIKKDEFYEVYRIYFELIKGYTLVYALN